MLKVVELFAGVGGFRIGLEGFDGMSSTSDFKTPLEKNFEVIYSNQYEPSTKSQPASDIYVSRFGLEGHSNVDINEVSTSEIPDHDLLVGGFPCFLAGTLILTSIGYKPIEYIHIGDLVLTHTNTYKKVTKTFINKTNHIYRLSTSLSSELFVTKEHPFYVKKTLNTEPIWINTKDLKNDYYLGSFIKTEDSTLIDGIYWFKYLSLIEEDYTGYVFNIEVYEDNSYTANNIIVHNCQDYSVATSSKNSKGILGKKGVLWWSIYRILTEKEIKPKYLLFENVDRLLISPSSQKGRDFAIILQSLNSLGYILEYRVLNAADYGFPQRRKRIFIIAYHKTSEIYNTISKNPISWILEKGVMVDSFPIKNSQNIQTVNINEDLVKLSNDFNKSNEHIFFDTGIMVDGICYTLKTIPFFDGNKKVLKDILTKEEILEEFYIKIDDIEKWNYLKGSKKISRTTSDGFEYFYSEGSMTYPDSLETPSRTIITCEGGSAPSRFKHIILDKERLRRLVPIELERLNGFPDNHTLSDGITNTKRAFFMGNALVIGIIEKISVSLVGYINKHSKGN